jgi:hypothetical protein
MRQLDVQMKDMEKLAIDSSSQLSAANQVLSTYELLEAIMLRLVPTREMLDDESVVAMEDNNKNVSQAIVAFLSLQRVNWFWNDVICDSRLIQTSLFMRESNTNLPMNKLEYALYDSNFILFDKYRWLDKDFSRLLKYAMAFNILRLLGEDTKAFIISSPASTEVELAYAYLHPRASWQRMHTSYYHLSDTYDLDSHVEVSLANGAHFVSQLIFYRTIHAAEDGSGMSLAQLMKEIVRIANAMNEKDRLHVVYHFRLICRLGQWHHDLAANDVLHYSTCSLRVDAEGRDYIRGLRDLVNVEPTSKKKFLHWSQPYLDLPNFTEDPSDRRRFQMEAMPIWLRSHPLKVQNMKSS